MPLLVSVEDETSETASFRDIMDTQKLTETQGPVTGLDPVCLVYTSGSTGEPSGVIVSNDNVCFTTAAILERLPYDAADKVGLFLPLSFDYGLYQVFLSVATGASLLIGNSRFFGPEIIEQARFNQISILPSTPTMISIMVRALDRMRIDLPHLHSLTSTGEHLSSQRIEKLRELIPGIKIYSMYGQTECKRISILLPCELEHRPGSVGRPLSGTEAFVVGADGNSIAPGGSGELVVSLNYS